MIKKYALEKKTLERLAVDHNSFEIGYSSAFHMEQKLNDKALLTFLKVPQKSSDFVFIKRSDSLGSIKSTLPFR